MIAGRYSRQELFAGIGPDGQARLRRARALVVGVGALGSVVAETLARAGVGTLTLVDRDFVEESNLQRQSLFDERDSAQALPKAVAAEAHLRLLNSGVAVRGVVADLAADNASALVAEADVVVDGTDNFETRFLLNDVCLAQGRPWVYGACVGSHGAALAVVPRETPCLRCLLGELPAAGSGPTCDTAGVLGAIVHVIAGIQAGEALKLLAGRREALLPGLLTVDVWEAVFELADLRGREPWCPACLRGQYDYSAAPPGSAVLCGRDAVQVRPLAPSRLDLQALASRLRPLGRVSDNGHLVRFAAGEGELVVFGDGRAIVKGARDLAQARSLYAKYVGA